jgi:hypothetical protein
MYRPSQQEISMLGSTRLLSHHQGTLQLCSNHPFTGNQHQEGGLQPSSGTPKQHLFFAHSQHMMFQINCHVVGLQDTKPQHGFVCEHPNLRPTLSQSQGHQQLLHDMEGLLRCCLQDSFLSCSLVVMSGLAMGTDIPLQSAIITPLCPYAECETMKLVALTCFLESGSASLSHVRQQSLLRYLTPSHCQHMDNWQLLSIRPPALTSHSLTGILAVAFTATTFNLQGLVRASLRDLLLAMRRCCFTSQSFTPPTKSRAASIWMWPQ